MPEITIIVILALSNGGMQEERHSFFDTEGAGNFIISVFEDFPEAEITVEEDGKPVKVRLSLEGELLIEQAQHA